MPLSAAMGRGSSSSGKQAAAPGAGLRLGRYTTVRLLGKGGMAEVYLAHQDGPAGFQKTCVVKRMRRALAEEPRFVDMFLREARVAARLNHANVVQIFELAQDGDEYFIAMEYLDGISLHRAARRCWANDTSIPMEVVLRAVGDAAMGLHHAHTQRGEDGSWAPLVHRDVSPDNLVITRDGVTKVLDFGIAKTDADRDEVTKTGELKGKIPYMSPEQIRGDALDGRSDLWSLGVTLYWLLTGKRPFDGGSDHMTIDHVLRADPVPPRELNPLIPPSLQNIILSLLQKNREYRLSSGLELRDRLVALLGPASGPGAASSFCNRVMDMPTTESNVGPSSVLTIVAARPETQWLKRVSESDDNGDLLSLVPARATGRITTPITGVRQTADVDTGETVSSVQTHPVALDASPAPAGRWAAVAAGIGLTGVMLVGAVWMLQSEAPAAPPPAAVAAAPVPVPSAPPPPAEAAAPPVEAVAPPAPPAAEPAPPAAAPKSRAATPRRSRHDTVTASGPRGITWRSTSGRRLGKGSGKLSVDKGTDTLIAVDGTTGGVITVPVKDGRADFGKVPKGQLVLRVRPWAKAALHKKALGTTPLDPVSLPAGKYKVTLSWNDKSKTETVTVRGGRRTVLKADMRQ